MKTYKKVLSIAGSDSGGGAGIQADIKTISACGCYAMTAITAITAQNTLGVSAVHVVPTAIVEQQIAAVIEDIGVDAVKLGMLPSIETIVAVARLLKRYKVRNIVMDPVMISTSGHKLIDQQAVEAIIEHILPISDLITPNIPEAEYLTGIKIDPNSPGLDWTNSNGHSTSDSELGNSASSIVNEAVAHEDISAKFQKAADNLNDKGAKGILIKSGHLKSEILTDYLFHNNKVFKYRYSHIETPNTHGTGCTLSSAIASYLALGLAMDEATDLAEKYIHEAILNGVEYKTGGGHGPVHHFYRHWD